MSTDSDRRRDLRRALLDGVVDAQFGFQCGGSSARQDSKERISVASTLSLVAIFDRTIDRSAA